MTHDELLAAVKDNPTTRAVVELHKSGRITLKTGEVVCDGCDNGDNYYSNFYPCPTIQAIEKELK